MNCLKKCELSTNPVVKEGANIVLLNGTSTYGLATILKNRLLSQNFNITQIANAYITTQVSTSIIDNSSGRVIEKIKNTIIELVHSSNEVLKINYSAYIEGKLNRKYNYLSNLFSEVEGITIEHYIISQKAEKVKELLTYNELNLSEIAYKLGYSSVAHLSTQFKKVTGLTPSSFKNVKDKKRLSLHNVKPVNNIK